MESFLVISGNVNYSSLSRVDTNNIHYNTQCWETYEKVKVFEIIESKKVRGNVKDPFGLKRFFSRINIQEEQLSILVQQNI